MTDGANALRLAATGEVLVAGSPLLFDANPLAMWVHDRDTLQILAVNEAVVRQYGWTRSQLLAMTVLDLLPPDDHPHPAANAAMTECLTHRREQRWGPWGVFGDANDVSKYNAAVD